MKSSKTFLISFSFVVFALIISLLYGKFCILTPELIASSVSNYKLLLGIKTFFTILPSTLATGACISWCIDFGKHPGNSRLRFSDAMFTRYKKIIINSLIFVFIITTATEICTPLINNRLKYHEKLPVLMKEYQHSAQYLYSTEQFEAAYNYAHLASSIDPDNERNKELLNITEIFYDKQAEISKSFIEKVNELTFNDPSFGMNFPKKKTASEPYKTYELLTTARNCFDEKDWFGAHYYATLALAIADNKDLNKTELKQIAAAAWNQLNQARITGTTEEQKVFAKKYEGYVSLINGDNLRAYYIFHALSLQSKKLSIDADVVRYLKIAEDSLKKQYFFADETKNLSGYETAHDVYFKLTDKETNSTTLYFIKGVTTSGAGTNMIQYLRGLEIISLDAAGFYRNGYYVPYAKMTSLQTSYFEKDVLESLGIDPNYKAIPYVLLNSVDRNLPNQLIKPEFKGGYDLKNPEEFLLLNMPFYDFDMIKQASNGANSMNLISIFNFVNKSETYGYSSEVFCQILMNRMMLPIYLLILFVVVAWLAWHFRLEENAVFKFKWIIMFPLLCIAFSLLYKLAITMFRFFNSGIISSAGQSLALPCGTVYYVIMLIIASVFFLACHNTEGK